MDSVSHSSLDSGDSVDSVAKNFFQEVEVGTIIHQFDPKEDVVEVLLGNSNEKSVERNVTTSDDSEDDDEGNTTTTRSSSTTTENQKSGDEKELDNVTKSSTTTVNTQTVPQTSQVISTATSSSVRSLSPKSNIKLVLKKSPDFCVDPLNPVVQAKTSPNKIFLVTLVSNSATGPVYSPAKTTIAGEKVIENIPNQQQPQKIATNISSIASESVTTPGNNLNLNLPSASENKIESSLKQEKWETKSNISVGCLDTKTDIINNSTTDIHKNETDDIDFVKSENDVKATTPKIVRELKQLQKTVNESKILSEYMNDNTPLKSRKSRKMPLKAGSPVTTEKAAFVAKHRSRSRSCSKPRPESPNDSMGRMDRWPSEERVSRRQNMRSQNTEFVQKHMKFLNRVQAEGDDSDKSDGETSLNDSRSVTNSENQIPITAKKDLQQPPKPGWDSFCFKCHIGGEMVPCSVCIRSYHTKCLKSLAPVKIDTWLCPECVAIDNCVKNFIKPGKNHFSVEHLSQLLQFALKRMKQSKGSQYFQTDINKEEHPDYEKYIINPISLTDIQKKIENKSYKCTEEMAVDSKWLQHNCAVFFEHNSKLQNISKSIVKICRQEVNEIETCAECYYNANTRKDWFVEVCSKPHILLWAKLKGFPYWPAKAMGINANTMVDVRFFGDHDRAYVPVKDCYLYSREDPNQPTKQNKRNNIAESIKEVDVHIRKISTRFGTFVYSPLRTFYDPTKEIQQMEVMIPGISEHINKLQKSPKPALTYKIVKTADNNLSIIKKPDVNGEKSTNTSNITDNSNISSNDSRNNISTLVVESSSPSPMKKNITKISEQQPQNETTTDKSIGNEIFKIITGGSPNIVRQSDESLNKTYEVVNRKEDNEEYRINSVILKRKTDKSPVVKRRISNTWNQSNSNTVVKKTKPDNDLVQDKPMKKIHDGSKVGEAIKRALNISDDYPKTTPVKRKRSRDDISSKSQKVKVNEDQIPPLVLLSQPHLVSPTSTSTSITTPAVISTPNTSSIMQDNNTNNVVLSITTSPHALSNNTEISDKTDKILNTTTISKNNSLPEKSDKVTSSSDQTIHSDTSTTETVESTANKEKDAIPEDKSTKKTDVLNVSKSPTPANDDISKSLEMPPVPLIPFDEIKSEKPDEEDTIDSSKQKSNQSETIEVIRSKTSSPEQAGIITNSDIASKEQTNPLVAAAKTTTTTTTTSSSTSIPKDNNTDQVTIKTEVISEDEEPPVVNIAKAIANLELPPEAAKLQKSEDIVVKRITVKDISKLQKPIKKLEHSDKRRTYGAPVTKHDFKKQQSPRARKSFPNKATVSAVITKLPASPLVYSNSKNMNSMVYIPVDSKSTTQKNIPVPPLTAVSKFTISQTSIAPMTAPISTSSPSLIRTSTPITLNTTYSTDIAMLNLHPTTSIIQTSVPVTTAITSSVTNTIVSNKGPNVTTSQSNSDTSKHMLSGFVTSNLAQAITDTIVRGPPKLVSRPTGPLRSDGDYVFPTGAGHVCKALMDNAHKMTDFFRSVIEDTLGDMANAGVLEAKVKLLEMELEKLKHSHAAELSDLKNNADLMLCEMKNSMENEKTRLISETRKQCEFERVRAVEDAKKKQWCAYCGKEAQFYCCWNTSYCDYLCQQKHWTRHMPACAQNNDNGDINKHGQKIGIKMLPCNMKEKQLKAKDMPTPSSSPRITTNFIRGQINVPRNSPPVQRLIPIPNQQTRFTIINREGNWITTPTPNFQPKLMPSAGLIMTEASGKSGVAHIPTPLMVDSLIRKNQL